MYIDLLSSALSVWDDDPSEAALVEHALTCRLSVLRSNRRDDSNALASLAADVSYDCALVKLCAAHHIDASATRFVRPSDERARLERALLAANVDLAGLAQRRSA